MNRTAKKCFVGVAAFHLMLLVILLVGPAFLSSDDKADTLQLITFEPTITTDKPFSSGGNPNATPPPAPATPPQRQQQASVTPPPPKPQPPRVERTAPVKQPDNTRRSPDALETVPDKSSKPSRKIEVNTTLTTRDKVLGNKATTPTRPSATDSANRSKDFANAARRIAGGTAPSTEIEPISGPGGGGPSYANYASLVKSKYTLAWIAPVGVDDDEATAKVRVTILRDGTVLSARITQSSGNAKIDDSVQATLDRVTFIAPFPEDSKDEQRSYIINFNLKAKELLG